MVALPKLPELADRMSADELTRESLGVSVPTIALYRTTRLVPR